MVKLATQLLKPLLLNPHWSLMEEYLAVEKSRLVTQLCNCNETQLKDLQGQIKALASISRLKEQLRTEMGSKR
jgi:hypothetical protein